jgi:redox-sensing transcriptional repressor
VLTIRTNEKVLPKATAKRFPLYFRYLQLLHDEGITNVKSHDLSKITQVPSATIRRDFSYIGELGRSGYGYEVDYLISVFSKLLHTEREKRIALVGCGNLGKALLNNNFRRNENLNITCAFDVDENLIGQEIRGIQIYSMEDFNRVVDEDGISVAISTVPSHHAQVAIDKIVSSGITAILNFAPDRVKVPKGVSVQYIDLTCEVQTLIYFDEHFPK